MSTTPSATALDTHGLLDPNSHSFVLSLLDVYSVQRYVASTVTLDPSSVQSYPDLATLYSNLKSHITQWKPILDADIQKLASDTNYYGGQTASYFPEILKFLQGQPSILTQPQDIPQAISDLYNLAVQYEASVVSLQGSISSFSSLIDGDNNANTPLITKLLKSIEDDNALIASTVVALNAATDAYIQLAIAANAIPSFLVIPGIGLLIAAVSAGVTGDAATQLLAQIATLRDTLVNTQARLVGNQATLAAAAVPTQNLTALAASIKKLSNDIDNVKGIWTSIKNDLNSIVTTGVTKESLSTAPFLQKDKVSAAIANWATLTTLVDAFRNKLYINVNK